MTVFVCLDDRGGMTFNRRRQSQDRCVRERVIQMVEGSRLRMNPYSAGQFEKENVPNLCVEENFLDKGEAGDYCFVENCPLAPYAPAGSVQLAENIVATLREGVKG